MKPQFIVHDPEDSVAVVVVPQVNKDQEASGFVMGKDDNLSLLALDNIPLGHKIALRDFKEGDTIIKYGHDIGKVVQPIAKGGHVHVHNVKTKRW